MASRQIRRTFATRREAEEWWSQYQIDAWGYSPTGRIEAAPDGTWRFVGSEWDSCD